VTEKRRVAVPIYPGVDELDVFGPYEILRIAAERRDGEVLLVSHEGAVEVEAAHGAVLRPQAALEGSWDVIVVPGGGWARKQGAFLQAAEGKLPARLAELHREGVAMASVCTGAMLLAAAGLTEGRPAVTHHAAIEDLRESGADIVAARVVDDGDLVTAGGVTAGIDLGLRLVERLWGPEFAAAIARGVEHEPVGEVHLGPRAGL
jgi:transcriptional regulator GlxA family with amidase domain